MPRMPSPRALLTSTLLATLATAGSAAADPAAPAAPTSPLRFPSLAPDGAVSEVAAEVAIGIYDGADVNLYSTHLSAQFVTPDRIGGYARVSAMSLDDAQALSDLELGGLYRADFTDATLALRAGVVLPTGPDQDSGFDEAFLPLFHLASRRPSDLAAGAVDSTVVRLAASPAVQRGQLFARADVGLDVFIDSPGDDNPDPLYHIDLAAGFKQGAAGATIELSSLGSLGSDASDDGTFDAITLGGQYDLGEVTVGGGLSIPFDTFDQGGLDVSGKILFANVAAKL